MKAVANKEYDLIPTLIVNSVQPVNIEETPKEEIKLEGKTETTTGGYTQVVVEEELPI